MKHIHHIKPRHMGGTDDPSNLIEVTPEEHAELHFALYLEHGMMGDWIAFHMLSGKTTDSEWARKEAMRDYFRRNVVSVETRKKMSEAAKRRIRKPFTEEAKRNISKALKGKRFENQIKAVEELHSKTYIITTPDGEEFIETTTQAELARKHNLNQPSLSMVLNGKRNHVGGWKIKKVT